MRLRARDVGARHCRVGDLYSLDELVLRRVRGVRCQYRKGVHSLLAMVSRSTTPAVHELECLGEIGVRAHEAELLTLR